MPFNGSGLYTRVHNWTQDAANGIDINANEMDAEDNSIAAAFNNCITRDGQGQATASQLPSADMAYGLGSVSLRWSSINGVAIGNYLTSANFGTITNPITPAETAAAVTPTFYTYSASPKVDPRRYGAIGNGSANDTAPLNTAMQVAYASRGTVELPEGYQFSCTGLTLTMTGTDSLNTSFAMVGQGNTSSQLVQPSGATTTLLTFQSSSPNTALQPAQLVLEGFGVTNNGNSIVLGAYGIEVFGLAMWRISNVQCRSFDCGITAINSLTGIIDDQCQLINNNVGLYVLRSGTFLSSNVQTNNMITARGNRLVQNAKWGVAFGGGSLLLLDNNDIESNGTSGNTGTGGVLTQGDLAGTFGYAKVELRSNWIEGNYGSGVTVLPLTSGSLFVDIDSGHIISTQNGNALNICQGGAGASSSIVKNVYSPSPADTWNIYAENSTIIGSAASNLNDTSVYRNYIGFSNSAGSNPGIGFAGTVALTLTGVSGTVVVNCEYILVGKLVTLAIGAVTGTSTSNACSLSGLPAALQPNNPQPFTITAVDPTVPAGYPSSAIIEAKGSGSAGQIGFNGPLTGGLFTSSGSPKGTYGATITYPLS